MGEDSRGTAAHTVRPTPSRTNALRPGAGAQGSTTSDKVIVTRHHTHTPHPQKISVLHQIHVSTLTAIFDLLLLLEAAAAATARILSYSLCQRMIPLLLPMIMTASSRLEKKNLLLSILLLNTHQTLLLL
jgi:hypothetical protein